MPVLGQAEGQLSKLPLPPSPSPPPGRPGWWWTLHTYIYDQILHGQGPGQLGDLIAKLVYVLKQETEASG